MLAAASVGAVEDTGAPSLVLERALARLLHHKHLVIIYLLVETEHKVLGRGVHPRLHKRYVPVHGLEPGPGLRKLWVDVPAGVNWDIGAHLHSRAEPRFNLAVFVYLDVSFSFVIVGGVFQIGGLLGLS